MKDLIKEYEEDNRYLENEAELPEEIIEQNKMRNKKKQMKKTPGKGIFVWDKGWDVVVGIMLGVGRTISTGGLVGNNVSDKVALDYKFEVNSFKFELP